MKSFNTIVHEALEENKSRKIIQIAVYPGYGSIIALCDDNTIWRLEKTVQSLSKITEKWKIVPQLPGTVEENNV